MSALENASFGLRAHGMGRRAAHERADNWMETVGLASRRDSGAADLSGGQAQRVALARALATEPRLVLLDEPFASVDDASRKAMLEVLAALEATTLIATHDQEIVSALADREVEMSSGKLL